MLMKIDETNRESLEALTKPWPVRPHRFITQAAISHASPATRARWAVLFLTGEASLVPNLAWAARCLERTGRRLRRRTLRTNSRRPSRNWIGRTASQPRSSARFRPGAPQLHLAARRSGDRLIHDTASFHRSDAIFVIPKLRGERHDQEIQI